jgi:ATP-dependent Clp protease ATP-binding subunit ClpA
VCIQDAALVAAARLASRYISGRFLPDKAIDLMDEACAHVSAVRPLSSDINETLIAAD